MRAKRPAARAAGEKKRIGILGFDGVQALDIFGPADAFSSAAGQVEDGLGYEVILLGLDRTTFATEAGIQVRAHATLNNAPPLDTVLVPGGSGIRTNDRTMMRIAEWVKSQAPKLRRIASVRTVAY